MAQPKREPNEHYILYDLCVTDTNGFALRSSSWASFSFEYGRNKVKTNYKMDRTK